MTAQETYDEILSSFENMINDNHEEQGAHYWVEHWPELKEAYKALWKENGKEGRPDPWDDSLDDEYVLGNDLGDADIALANADLWAQRKQFNEDLLNEFEYSEKGLDYNNHHYAIAECIKELEGMEQALAYADEWKKEEPESTFPDAVKISLLYFNKQYQEARLIADPYMDRIPGTVDGEDLLFDMCDNLYKEIKDEEYIAKLLKHRLKYVEQKYEEARTAHRTLCSVLGERAVRESLSGADEIFQRLIEAGWKKEQAYWQIGAIYAQFSTKTEDEDPAPLIAAELQMAAKTAEYMSKAKKAGRFETLEQLIYAKYVEVYNEESDVKIHEADYPLKTAQRLLSPGAFRNLFISMHDNTMSALKRVIDDPQTAVNEEELNLLLNELRECIITTDDNHVYLSEDFIEQFQKLDTPEFEEKRKLNSWVLDCLYMTHHCYGVLKDTDLLKMIAVNGTKLTIKDVRKIWQSLPSERKYCTFEGGYVFDEFFGYKKEYVSVYTNNRKKYPLTLPSVSEIDGLYVYGYPRKEPSYQKAFEYLKTLTVYETEVYIVLDHLFNQITANDSLQQALQVLEKNENIMRNMDPKKISDIIVDMMNHTRRWDIFGNKPSDPKLKTYR